MISRRTRFLSGDSIFKFRDSLTGMDSRFRGNDVIFSETRYFYAGRHSRESMSSRKRGRESIA